MKNIILSFLIITAPSYMNSQEFEKMISSGKHTVKEIKEAANKHFEKNGKNKKSGYKQFKRWEYRAERLADENGFLKSTSFYVNELKQYNKKQNIQAKKMTGTTANWEALGPTSWSSGDDGYAPGIGRLTSIAIDSNNGDHIIVGSPGGGVWKTTNKGNSWTSLCDNFPDMYVYALAIHPTNPKIYFWGSSGGDLYKSKDAGATWETMNTIWSGLINKILIKPNNPSKMYVSVQGSGFYRTQDAGANWEKITTDNTGYDIEFKPEKYNTMYASGNKFHKSTDGGVTWVTNNSKFDNAPKMIGVSPANRGTVYVIEAKNGAFNGFFVSTNSGDSFTKKSHPDKNYFGYSFSAIDDGGQAPRDMAIAVSSTDVNDVYIAGINPFRSLDGGTTFTSIGHWILGEERGYCHADVDDMLYYGNELFVVSDGGIFNAENPEGAINRNYFKDLSLGLGIQQLYKLGISQSNNPILLGGAQDNGLNIKTNNPWKQWYGADGMECFVDKNDKDILYGVIQEGDILKSENRGNSVTYSVSHPNGYGSWVTPFEQDPITPNRIFIGYSKVYRSNNGGDSWKTVSQDFNFTLDQLKIAPSNNKIIYASTYGELYKTTTGEGTWTLVDDFDSMITSIAIHPTKPNKVAIAVNNSSKVYITTDGGKNWKVTKTGLPNFKALALVWEDNGKDGLYLGMNYGVYYLDNTLSSWQNFSNLLPNVEVSELEINAIEGKLYAATYGRGMWKTDLYKTEVLSTQESILSETVKVFPNTVKTSFNIAFNTARKAELRLFNVHGELVFYNRLELFIKKNIDISNYATGVYFLRISTPEGIVTKKIIKA